MKIFSKIKSFKTARDSMLTMLSNLISQVLSFVVVVLVSNVLSVAQYGLYCVLNSISSFVSDMADMGMNGAITRFVAEYRGKGEEEQEEQIISYSLRRKIINILIVFVVLILFAKPIAKYWFHNEKYFYLMYLVMVSCFFSLLLGALRAILQGRQQFVKYFWAVVLWNAIWCGSILIMVLTNTLTVFSSVLAGTISGCVNLILCAKFTNISITKIKNKKNIDSEIKHKFNKFGNWMMLWALFSILQSKLDVFMLASLTTPEQVSYYDVASKVIKPILMVVSAYAQVLNPQFASIPYAQIKSKLRSVIKFIILITIGIVVAIFLIKPVILLLFGHKYDQAIIPAQMLLFAIVFFVWTVPSNSVLYALNMPHIFTIAAFVGLVVTAIGDFVLLGKYGVIGAALTYIAAQVVGFLIASGAIILNIKRLENDE